MNDTTKRGEVELWLAVLAALLVLFSAMWDARVSVVVAVILLLAYPIYRLIQDNRPHKRV